MERNLPVEMSAATESRALRGSITCANIFRERQTDKSGRRDLNSRHAAWKAAALPLSYSRMRVKVYGLVGIMARDNMPPHGAALSTHDQPKLVGKLG